MPIIPAMTKDEVLEFFGTQIKLAAALKLSQSTVSGWKDVPLEHQFYLEKLTDGALKADPHPAEAA